MMTRPQEGERIRLDLGELTETRVTYRVTLHHESPDFVTDASVDRSSGEIELSAFAGEIAPPTWLVDQSRAFLVTLSSQRKNDPEKPWPRRLTRWRAPK